MTELLEMKPLAVESAHSLTLGPTDLKMTPHSNITIQNKTINQKSTVFPYTDAASVRETAGTRPDIHFILNARKGGCSPIRMTTNLQATTGMTPKTSREGCTN